MMIFRESSDKHERLGSTGGSPVQFSAALIKENMRRFWPIPLVSLVYYFLIGVFPLILRSAISEGEDHWYFRTILVNENPGMYIAALFVPVFAAVAVFGYIHKTASVSYMHAMPFSRARLFDTGFISGLLMCWLPVVITGFMFFAFCGGAETSAYAVFLWIVENLLVILFNYSVCALSACIAGTAVHQILLSFFLLYIAPVMWLLGQMYMELYLKGYSMNNSELARIFNPWIYMILERHFSIRAWIFFSVFTLVLIILSYILYKKRKMERAGDGLVYGFMVPVVSYIAAFLGMTMLGVYFESMIGSESRIFGYLAGAFLGFMISRMILFKSAKIFNKRFWINLGIYSLIAIVFITGLVTDVFGYGKRVPENAEYAGLNLWIAGSGYLSERYGLNDYGITENYGDFIFKDTENIEHIKALQRELVELQKDADLNGKSYDAFTYDADEYSVEMPNKRDILNTYGSIDISYKIPSLISDNSMMYRHYEYVPFGFMVSNEHLKAIFESEEYKDNFGDSGRLGKGKGVNSIEIDISSEESYKTINLSGSEASGFAKAMDADFVSRSWEDYMELIAESVIESPEEKGQNYVRIYFVSILSPDEMDSFSENLTDKHVNALNWLKDHGYGDILHDDPETIKN